MNIPFLKFIFLPIIGFALILTACESANPVEPGETGWYPFGKRIPEQGTIWCYNYYDYDLSYYHHIEKNEFWSKGTFKIEITSSSTNSQPPFFKIEKTTMIDTSKHEYTEQEYSPDSCILRTKVETDLEQKNQYKLILMNDSLYYEIEGQKKLFSASLISPGTSINALLFHGRDVYLKTSSEYVSSIPSLAVELEKGKGITLINYFDAYMGISGYKHSFSCNLTEYTPGRN